MSTAEIDVRPGAMPEPGLFDYTEDQLALRKLVREFAETHVAPLCLPADRDERIPRELLERMADLGFFGGLVPEELGGMGLDHVTYSIVLEEMARVDHLLAVLMSMPSSLVGAGIHKFGTQEQHERWLRPMAQGRLFGAAGVTEPRSGSDVAGMESTYVRDGDAFVVRGTKAWISNLDLASFFVTFASRDRSLGRKGISAFIIPADTPGVSVKPFRNKMGFRAICTGEVVLDDVILGPEHLLGDEGHGFAVAMSAVEAGRLGVASRAVGLAQACLDDSIAYAKERVVFGQPIAEYQLTKSKITDMAVGVNTARLLVQAAARSLDRGQRSRMELSMAKMYATDVAQRSATEAVQIHGAYGCHEDFRVGRMYRDAKIFQIIEGPNEIHRLLIAEYLLDQRAGDGLDPLFHPQYSTNIQLIVKKVGAVDERLNWLISVDDHVIEPPGVWQDRVPQRFKEAAPHIVADEQGEAWVYEGRRFPTVGLAAAAGRKKEEFSPTPVSYQDMRPGCYDPVARLEDMDRDGVLASLCFPSFPRFCGQTFYEASDRELGLLCVKAYNDWMVDEWSGSAPGRFIPGIILPLWDPVEGAREIERCAAKGAKAVIFSENPAMLGLPSIHDKARYWDPVFAAASDTGLPVCIHIGSSSKLPATSPDNPLIVTLALTPMNAMVTCVDWLFSGNFERHANLKLCLSEGGIGWIPYVLERCDYTLDRQGAWAAKGDFSLDLAGGKVEAKEGSESREFELIPSQLFKERVFGCFIDDIHGVDCLDAIGVDNVMIETDYPHTDSSWPNSIATAHKRLAGRRDEEIYKIFQGNAKRVFNFEPAPIPANG